MILAGILDLFSQDVFGQYSTEGIPLEEIIFIVFAVFLLSLIILFTYKRAYQTTVYNRSFALSLPIVAMVTSVIIISVSSNIILSLGMVGALSIVRFRTAIKNPFDTVFMFWAVGLGVTSGAGLILVAVISTLAISLVIFLLIALETFVTSYFLIIRANSVDFEKDILDEITRIYGKFTLRNKTIKNGKLDLTLEVRSKEEKVDMVNTIKNIDSVLSVSLLSHNGDYISE